MPRQIGNGDHRQAMLVTEPNEVRDASHRAVVIQNLANNAGREQTCKSGEIDRRLGMTGTLKDATAARTKGKDMSRSREVFRRPICINGGLDRTSSLARRNTGGHALARRVDRDGKCGAA